MALVLFGKTKTTALYSKQDQDLQSLILSQPQTIIANVASLPTSVEGLFIYYGNFSGYFTWES